MTTGGLGAPFDHDEIPFEAIQRAHFDALSVQHGHGAPHETPLLVRLNLLGDSDDASVAKAFAWLEEHANVVVEVDRAGGPLYLTASDLSATSGRATLGATLRTGMAAEVRNPNVAPCVIAHEILHFLGLKHVEDSGNIMHGNCGANKLDHATMSPEQRHAIDSLGEIRAVTPRGTQVWAERLG